MATEEHVPQGDEAWELWPLTPRIKGRIGEARSLWYESPAEVRAGLRRGAEREILMRWVRRQMKRRLSSQERACVELHYLEGKTFREVGEEMELPPATVARLVADGIAKLRVAARKRERARRRR